MPGINQKRAYLLALSAVLAWSTVATAFKLALNELQLLQVLLISSMTATSFLLVYVLITNRFSSLIKQDFKNILTSLIMGFFNPYLYYVILFKAYDLLPAQEALSLNYSWVIVVVILSIIFLKQKISLIQIVGLIISFSGVIIIATKGNVFSLSFSNKFGVFLALLSSIVWGLYWILNLKDKRDDIIKLFTNFLFGSIFIFITYIFKGEGFDFHILKILPSIYVGIFEMGLTFVLWLSALRYSENTAKVGNLIFLSPFLSLLIISIILKESIQISTIIGLILIIFGTTFQKRRNNSK